MQGNVILSEIVKTSKRMRIICVFSIRFWFSFEKAPYSNVYENVRERENQRYRERGKREEIGC